MFQINFKGQCGGEAALVSWQEILRFVDELSWIAVRDRLMLIRHFISIKNLTIKRKLLIWEVPLIVRVLLDKWYGMKLITIAARHQTIISDQIFKNFVCT